MASWRGASPCCDYLAVTTFVVTMLHSFAVMQKNVGEVDLEVENNELTVEVEDQYELVLELPTPVDEDNPKATYDKAVQKLTLSLPHL